MRNSEKSLIINNVEIYNYYRERLINLALSQFEWHGLPETCNRLFMEKSLLFNGKACFIKPEGTDFWLSTDWILKGPLDVYGWPTDIRGVGFGQYNHIEGDEWEVFYDNMTLTSLLPKIDMYAKLLWECHNTYRSNLQQQITPYVVLTSKNESLSVKNMFNRIFGFQPVVEVKNTFDPSTIQTIDTRVDFKGKELLENLKVLWAEALSMLGITGETSKKERLISDEIVLNRQEDVISLNSRLSNRIEICNKMNKKYGWNLSVNLVDADTKIGTAPDGVIDTLSEFSSK